MKSTNRYLIKLALILSRKYETQYAEHLEECEMDRKRGHRPHYCEHGTNLHVDYDPMCGGCEEGYSMSDGLQRRTQALYEARQRMDRATRIGILAIQLQQEMPGLDMDPIVAEIQRLQNGE